MNNSNHNYKTTNKSATKANDQHEMQKQVNFKNQEANEQR